MAKTEHYFTKFEAGKFYHIYNRSVDRKPMFKNEGNYVFFLKKYLEYLSPVVDTYAYTLLGNHFHLMVRIKDMADLVAFDQARVTYTDLTTFQKLSNLTPAPTPSPPKTAHEIVTHQFRKFFQSYAMAFNKQHNRVGTLFQTPFKRVLIDSDSYFTEMIYYIHGNAQKHGLVADFRNWKWSSYHSFLSQKPTALQRKAVLDWFGGIENFVECHDAYRQQMNNNRFDLDEEGDC